MRLGRRGGVRGSEGVFGGGSGGCQVTGGSWEGAEGLLEWLGQECGRVRGWG